MSATEMLIGGWPADVDTPHEVSRVACGIPVPDRPLIDDVARTVVELIDARAGDIAQIERLTRVLTAVLKHFDLTVGDLLAADTGGGEHNVH